MPAATFPAAGIATIKILKEMNPYPCLSEMAELFADKINNYAKENKLAVNCKAYGGVFTLFFTTKQQINNLEDIKSCNTKLFAAHHRQKIERAADSAIEFLVKYSG